MQSKPEPLKLTNICGGAVEEIFERAVSEIVKNIEDPNTPPDQKRAISLTFTFKPSKDRTVAAVGFSCNTKLAMVDPKEGTIFLSRATGTLKAYPRDVRQDQLFAQAPAATPETQ